MNLKELQYLNPKSILDIGANAGFWSKEAKGVWPDAEIFMIEGNPACEDELSKTGFPFAICILAEQMKMVTFYQRKCGGTSTGDSIYRENTPWYDDENLVETKAMAYRLDKICGDYEPDLVKIDCQGSELDILMGGAEVISHSKYIILEVPADIDKPYNIGAPTRWEVMDYMTSIGFRPDKVLEDIVHPLERHIIQQDILFVRA